MFQQLPNDPTHYVVCEHAKAHICQLKGSLLMIDTSRSIIHLMHLLLLANLNNVPNYSWGLTVLASLYCALDHGVDFKQENV